MSSEHLETSSVSLLKGFVSGCGGLRLSLMWRPREPPASTMTQTAGVVSCTELRFLVVPREYALRGFGAALPTVTSDGIGQWLSSDDQLKES